MRPFVDAFGGAFVAQLEAGAAQQAQEPPITPIARHGSMGLADEGIANHDVAGLGAAAQQVAIAQEGIDFGFGGFGKLYPDFRDFGVGFELELGEFDLGRDALHQTGQPYEDGLARCSGRVHGCQRQRARTIVAFTTNAPIRFPVHCLF
jgi:hypothetical protein